MLISVNPKPTLAAFQELMTKTDILLNEDAKARPSYYAKRSGNPLEDDVKAALDESSKGTPFENTIEKVSGQKFPDIVAAKYYGVEVKSTKEDHWTSTGSSILETTRLSDVERIYMTFGKLGGTPAFLSRPYEECLHGIAVTHMPRYLINMQLKEGETIFDKMGIPYDTLRNLEDPIAPVSKYYRSKLKPGESLWWAGNSADESVSATIRLWKNLEAEEKKRYIAYACVHFPEIFAGDYDNYALWLTSQGVVDSHIRDQFSAGGQETLTLSNGELVKFPGVYRRVKENKDLVLHFLIEYHQCSKDSLSPRLLSWIKHISRYSSNKFENVDFDQSVDALTRLLT